MSAVTLPPRWVYAIGGLATILLYPSLRWVDFYFSARAMSAAAPEMAARADSLASAMSERRMLCSLANTPGRVTPDELADIKADFGDATSRYTKPITAEKGDEVDRILKTRALQELLQSERPGQG